MEMYGWTYEQYMDTPHWVIDLIAEKGNIDAKVQNLHNKKANGK